MHKQAALARKARENGFWAGQKNYPVRKVTPQRAADRAGETP